MRTKLVFILLALFATPVAGQTESEIEQKYGKPTLAYSVTEHIWMTPDFAADGRVCQMRFYPKRVEHGITYLNGTLALNELKWILNYVVPPVTRGKRTLGFGMSTFGGGMAVTDYSYEKLNISSSSSFRIQLDAKALQQAIENSELSFDFTGADGFIELPMPPEPPPASEADFDNLLDAEIVVLSWKDRKCVEDVAAPVEAPRVAEVEQQFGQPQKIYSVGPFTSMTPAFAADGQVCRMWVYPKRISAKYSVLGNTLQVGEVRPFLYMLVPLSDQRRVKIEIDTGTTSSTSSLSDLQLSDQPQIATIRWPRMCAGF